MSIPVVAIERYDSQRVTYSESPLLNPTGIQFVTKAMLGTTREEHRNLSVSRRCLCSGTEYGLYCWDAESVPESELRSQYCVSIALAFCRGATGRLSIHDYASRASLFFVLPEYPPRISSLKPVVQRDKYEEYILYTTRQGFVSGVTIKSDLYVFLVCSIGHLM